MPAPASFGRPVSDDSARILQHLQSLGSAMPDTERPPWLSADRLYYLIDLGLVEKITLCPPGKEDPSGLIGFRLSPAGSDALSAFQQEIQNRAEQERKEKEQSAKDDKAKKQQFRHDLLVASIGAAVGSAVTGFIDHFAEICALVEKLIDKILSLLH